MERFFGYRFTALLLALLLAASCALPAAAAATPPAGSVPFTEVTPPDDAALRPPYSQIQDVPLPLRNEEPLRAIIVLEKPSLLEKGYDAADLAAGGAAAAYNEELQQEQETVIAAIEAATGEPLDVVWRLTVVANLLSVWVVPAQIDIIAAVPGVRSVREEAVAVLLEDEGEDIGGENGDEQAAAGSADGVTAAGEAPDSADPAAEDTGTETSGREEPNGEASVPENSGDSAADGEPATDGPGSEASFDEDAAGGPAGGEEPGPAEPAAEGTADGASISTEPAGETTDSGTAASEAPDVEAPGEEALPEENADSDAATNDGPVDEAGADGVAAIAEINGLTPTALFPVPDWELDYKGDGQRIAIIDTGTDEWHHSLNSNTWMYALNENADLLDPAENLTNYLATLDLLDADGVAEVLDDLAVVQRNFELPLSAETRQEILEALTGHGEAETLSGHSLRKVAFGANYSGSGRYDDIAHHDRDEHGSHVAGIAAANLYVPTETCWDPVTGRMKPGVDASYEDPRVTLTNDAGKEDPEVFLVRGQAPNAQLLVMQVFSSENGCAESDYMAAIQDALLLGAGTINLSLGSNEQGATFALEPVLQDVVDRVAESGAIVSAAYGNSYYWTHPHSTGDNFARLANLLYADDVSYNTGGDPAAYDTLLSVAAAHIVTDGAETTARMSDFSSWGVPSTLELKPEITAPGEDIASLNGAHDTVEWLPSEMKDLYARHDNYEEMSGTSMASPQIAGMEALVLEHLKTTLAKDEPGKWSAADRRRIAQSLLMSTAVPMADPDDPDGNYYPVLQQGAGLANAKKAVTANAYITMEENAVFRPRSAAGGKVKAELGANDNGYFIYTFTVHNLDPDDSHSYTLRTDLFTQELNTLSDNKTPALGLGTTPLPGDVRYNGVDGEDFSIEVPAGGTATVKVEIQIDDPAIANYPAGAYVEGYTWLFPNGDITSDRDVHSIPLLGFYGNWSDSSMFDHVTAYDKLVLQAAGLDPDKDDPYAEPFNDPCGPPELYTAAATALRRSYTGSYVSEQLTAQSAKTGERYLLTGNPWFLEPERPLQQLAVNRDDALLALKVLSLRNAILDMEIDRADDAGKATGADPLWSSDSLYAHAPWALFDAWWDVEPSILSMDAVTPQDLGLLPGDRFALRVAAIPESYWQTELKNWPASAPLSNWDMRRVLPLLGEGALREYPLWVDSGVGPAVNTVTGSGNSFTVTVQDDLYTAWVTVLDTDFAPLPGVEGDAFISLTGTESGGWVPNLDPDDAKRPTGPGQPYDAVLTFRDAAPEQFIIMVGDYAGNARYYLVDTAVGTMTPVPYRTPGPDSSPTPEPSAAPTEPIAPATPTPTPVPTAVPVSGSAPSAADTAPDSTPTPTPAAALRIPRTADGLPLTALYVVLGASAAGLTALLIVWYRRRRK